MASSRTLLQIDPNSARLDTYNSSDADSMPATPSKDKFREWTFPRAKAGPAAGNSAEEARAGPASALASSTATGPRPGFASSTSRTGGGIRTGKGGSIAARRPSVAQRASSRAAGDFAGVTSPSKGTTTRPPGDVAHGRSSSIAHKSSPKKQRSNGSTDFRHRSNASVASPIAQKKRPAATHSGPAAATSFVKLNMPIAEGSVSPPAPGRLSRLAVSLIRRRSLGEVIYLVLFSGSVIIWAAALCGYGHTGPVPAQPADLAIPVKVIATAGVIDVRLPDTLLPPQDRSDNDEYLADVHQREGDASHDDGDDHFQASPLDPALADEHVADVHHNEAYDSLWSDHDLDDPDVVAQALLATDADGAVDVEGLDHSYAPSETVPSAADDTPDISFDLGGSETADTTEHDEGSEQAIERDLAEAADPDASEEEEDGTVEDDSIPIEEGEDEGPSGDGGPLHVVDADDGPGAPTALDELLDSAAEEHQETLSGSVKDVPADALFRAPGTKNRKLAQKRSAKAQAKTKRTESAATLAQRDQQGMKVIIRRD
ncbi:hypothetical protein JCM8115_005938 [Rhodotorula mucilaginosa]|uniref:Uncharacterized protein n=1 Tax=Rhodotorula mucilaginosa TaxID=5537 RepID=A0A9P6W061_RHOMI|nr:hypothetical protein C6P46_004820 [Rhodotorula mucilaginosa]TKA51282.1 hypothetical protein B0A53_05589 [Rhodotorula sp. CCFEE 5036]